MDMLFDCKVEVKRGEVTAERVHYWYTQNTMNMEVKETSARSQLDYPGNVILAG